MKYLVAIIVLLGSVFFVQSSCAEDTVPLGLNDYVQNTLKVKTDPNRAIYYASCLFSYYRFTTKLNKEAEVVKDRLSSAIGSCIGTLLMALRVPTKVEAMVINPAREGCVGGATAFYSAHSNVHSGADEELFGKMLVNICIEK